MSRLFRVIGVALILGPTTPMPARAQQVAPSAADRALSEGDTAFRSGDFASASGQWALAVRLYSEARLGGAQVHALLRLAEAQQALGDYGGARESLTISRSIVHGTADERQRAEVLGALGNVLSTLSRAEADRAQRAAVSAEAVRSLQEALALAEKMNETEIAAATLINLGNHHAAEENNGAARAAYSAGADVARRKSADSLAARALANDARVAQRTGDWEGSEAASDSRSRSWAASRRRTIPPLLRRASASCTSRSFATGRTAPPWSRRWLAGCSKRRWSQRGR